MLEELKKLNYPIRREDILFFLQDVIASHQLSVSEIQVMCMRASGHYQLNVDALLAYCNCLNLIESKEKIRLTKEVIAYINDSEQLNCFIVERTLNYLFLNEILTADMFSFNIFNERYFFKNECLSLAYAQVRNILVSQGFFEIIREGSRTDFFISRKYEKLISYFCSKKKRTLELEQLKKKLEMNARAGELAEQYVLFYEKKRVGNSLLADKIKIISDIDVCAGYDIVSFDSLSSSKYDRFIEVKAVSSTYDFFWSANELGTAKLKGEQYYLYLVDLRYIYEESYAPVMINNPAINVMESEDWLVEPNSFRIWHT